MPNLKQLKETVDQMVSDAEKEGKDLNSVPVAYALWTAEDVNTAATEHNITLTEDEIDTISDSAHDGQDGSNESFWKAIHEGIRECIE